MRDRAGSSAMKAEKLLEQAAAVIVQRRNTYGQPIELFEHVAKRWSLVLGVEVTAAQTAIAVAIRPSGWTPRPRSASAGGRTASRTHLRRAADDQVALGH